MSLLVSLLPCDETRLRITTLLSEVHSIAQLGPDGHWAAKISFSNAPKTLYLKVAGISNITCSSSATVNKNVIH